MDESPKTIILPLQGVGSAGAEPVLVQRIGRFRVERVLGQGGFGLVYLAVDEQLSRRVAIKVPHARLISEPAAIESYLREARIVANFDHPNIVPVFDVGVSEQFPCYIVSKYIDGTDLSERLKQGPLSLVEAVELTASVADALQYAHKHRLVHRDIKPANILLDHDGQPYVTDFGLAVQDQDVTRSPSLAGTPAYMSPEQARGEGHRLDGRSDIFSLGIVMYEMLVGDRPFRAESRQALIKLIDSVDVRPPRQIDDRIPKELERICLKSLSKRASERYTTAKDMADDLRHWIASLESPRGRADDRPPSAEQAAERELALALARLGQEALIAHRTPSAPSSEGGPTASGAGSQSKGSQPSLGNLSSDNAALKIVPKGLRSFDAHDADFFLELLAGPRDRDGLPESIRFWKLRIEQTDPDDTFCVGLIYGPSGCGKSSLIKAGLLPRLSANVIPIYIEATADETESRLLNGLRKRCPDLAPGLGLKETLFDLRRGDGLPKGKKVLIVLDQFEQWLHAKNEEQDIELVHALRQCDGGRVQCLLMVRDDFWMAATQFMRELEIRLMEGQNSAAVDLLPRRHAEKVLTAFGRAFGAIPEDPREITSEQKQFVAQAIAGLADEGKVVCVRLALFAEMVKNKPWTPAALKAVGGTEGVGVTFLEETFSSPAAPPEHRYHQKAARAVLKALLPESGSDIKGHMQSSDVMLAASGLTKPIKDFHELIRILDADLRLITPTDPEGATGDDVDGSPTRPSDANASSSRGSRYYQLAHDYLVPSLRQWLTRKQQETRRGRAELLLAERAAAWNAVPENRRLPSLMEFARIRLLTQRKNWSERQRKMMAKGGWTHSARVGLLAAVLTLIATAGAVMRGSLIHGQRLASAQLLADSLVTADIVQVDGLLKSLGDYRPEAIPILETKFTGANAESDQRLWLAAALLPDTDKEAYLLDRLLGLSGQRVTLVCDAILPAAKDKVITLAQAELAKTAPAAGREDERETLARRQATAGVALLRCEAADRVWPLLKMSEDPSVRSYLIHWAGPLGCDRRPLLEHFERESDASIRSALIQMLGEFTESHFPAAERAALIDKLLVAFQTEPDPSVHAATYWLLRQWKQGDRVSAIADKFSHRPVRAADRPRWFVNSQGQTFVTLPGGQFTMGSPETEPSRFANETPHRVRLGRQFAVAATLVTRAQYRAFQQDAKTISLNEDQPLALVVRTDDSPQTAVTWYEAAQYCNWLSRREGLPECYEPNASGEFAHGMKAKDGYLELAGYRLPTEAEWEYACRAGTTTSRYFGNSATLLPSYAWYAANGQDRTWPVASLKPNDFGLFDMLGNAYQWCDEENMPYHAQAGKVVDDVASNRPLADLMSRILRGGMFDATAHSVRSACRGAFKPNTRLNFVGFRPVRTCP